MRPAVLVIAFGVGLGALVAWPRRAGACDCDETPDAAAALREATDVVELEVRRRRPRLLGAFAVLDVVVSRSWKGSSATEAAVFDHAWCSAGLQVGRRYVVYARRAPGVGVGVTVSRCSRIVATANDAAAEDLRALGPPLHTRDPGAPLPALPPAPGEAEPAPPRSSCAIEPMVPAGRAAFGLAAAALTLASLAAARGAARASRRPRGR